MSTFQLPCLLLGSRWARYCYQMTGQESALRESKVTYEVAGLEIMVSAFQKTPPLTAPQIPPGVDSGPPCPPIQVASASKRQHLPNTCTRQALTKPSRRINWVLTATFCGTCLQLLIPLYPRGSCGTEGWAILQGRRRRGRAVQRPVGMGRAGQRGGAHIRRPGRCRRGGAPAGCILLRARECAASTSPAAAPAPRLSPRPRPGRWGERGARSGGGGGGSRALTWAGGAAARGGAGGGGPAGEEAGGPERGRRAELLRLREPRRAARPRAGRGRGAHGPEQGAAAARAAGGRGGEQRPAGGARPRGLPALRGRHGGHAR